MFDSTKELVMVPRPGSSAHGNLSMRWPTEDEWEERARTRKILIRRLGRGVNETEIRPSGEFDLKLWGKIKLNGAPELTPGEATFVVDQLAKCDILDVEMDGDQAVVQLRVFGGRVKHRLRLPTADEVIKLRDQAAKALDLPYGRQELRIALGPGARLWDACAGSSEDYIGPVPGPHKDTAVRAVIDYIDQQMESQNDEENF